MIFHGISIDDSRIENRNYKENPLKRMEFPSKAEVEYLYLECDLTLAQLQEFYCKGAARLYPSKYGIVKPKSQQIETMKRTNLEKYGCTSSMLSKEVQEKRKQTYLKNYGLEWGLQDKKVREKIKQTNLEKYGVEHFLQSKDAQERIKKTNLEKYGIENVISLKETRDKIRKTNLQKYGFGCSLQNSEVSKKAKNTLMQKYGCSHSDQMNFSKEALSILSSKENLSNFIENCELKTISYIAKRLNISLTTMRTYCHLYDIWDLIDQHVSSYELEIQNLFPGVFLKQDVLLLLLK